MNVSNSIKCITLAFLLNTNSLLPAHTNPLSDLQLSEKQINELQSQFAKIMDGMVTRIIHQIGQIESILLDLSLSINNNAFGEKNKEELLVQIKNIGMMVNKVKSEAFLEVSPQTLGFLVVFSQTLMEHISDAIEDGVEDFSGFEELLAGKMKRSGAIDLEKIEQKILENEEDLEELIKDVNETGLTWVNKSARKFNNWLIVAHRNKVDSAVMLASVSGVLLTHFLMKYTSFGEPLSVKYLKKAAHLENDLKKGTGNRTEENTFTKIRYYLAKYYESLEKEKSNGLSVFKWPGHIFRKVFGYSPILKDGDVSEGGIAFYIPEEKNINAMNDTEIINLMNQIPQTALDIFNEKHVGWFGETDLSIQVIASIIFSGYVPIIKFMYGPSWYSDLGGWFKKKGALVYGKLLGGNAAKAAEKAQKEEDEIVEPKYTFDDVVGLDHIKEILNRVLEYIKDPDRFDRANIPPERGYLFTGLPGTGKSFVAEAFGGEIRKVFEEIGRNKDEVGFCSFPAEFINNKGIGWLLNIAKKESPCVIFIDEIDLLKLQRGNGNSELLSEFLSSMSGVLSKEAGKQVILLAATNRPEHLDKALRRRGRFGKIVHFEMPTVAERKSFLVRKLEPLLPDLSILDLDKISEETEGRTYEELNAMFNAAFQDTKINGVPLSQKQLERALDEEIRNIISKNMHISKEEQKMIASHLAGHALALELLRPRRELAGVTIKPITADLEDESVYAQYYGKRKQKDVEYGKIFLKCPTDHLDFLSREEKIEECKVVLAGMVAERILLGSCGHSYHTNDKQEALDIVKTIVFEGLHVKGMPKQIQLRYFEQALADLKQYEQEITALLTEQTATLEAIAEQLQEEKTLSVKTVKNIIEKMGGITSTSEIPTLAIS